MTSIAIIGAGIAGLAAGCYGQMNGYDTQLFELHDKPGGLCTAWKRQGYTFDGCLHWLVGTRPGSAFNRIWQELGAGQGPVADHEEFARLEGKDGRALIFYTNVDRLEQHLHELAPADGALIADLCGAIRRLIRAGDDLCNVLLAQRPFDRFMASLKMLPLAGVMRRYSRTSVQDFARRFQDPFVRETLGAIYDMPDFPLITLPMTLAWMHNHDAGYPLGGSLEFARAIERRYLELGGLVHYSALVDKILVENGRAVGVRLSDGSEQRADVVISAADGHATIFDMLEGKYIDERIRGYYRDMPIFQPIIQVSLGVARDFSAEPQMTNFMLAEPVTIAGQLRQWMGVRHFSYDPSLAPAGKSSLVTILGSNYDYWQGMYQNRTRYEAEKAQIAATVISQLNKRYPGLAEQIEVVDVATPLTYERYTGNWRASMEGWMITTKTAGMMMGNAIPKTLPGLANFYMAGQWVEPGGGVPPAALSGRKVIHMICQKDRRAFRTEMP